MNSDGVLMDSESFRIKKLGESSYPSPMKGVCFTQDDDTVLYHTQFREIEPYLEKKMTPPAFEMAGPRETIFFDPDVLNCGIVTCGGLCPGLNDVIRAIVLCLHHHYGVKKSWVFGMVTRALTPHFTIPRWSSLQHESMIFTRRAAVCWAARAGHRIQR